MSLRKEGWLQRQPRGAAVVGPITVESVDGATLNLVTADGWRRSVDTTGVTITRDGDEITVADIAVGDTVRIRQTRADDGSWTVRVIGVVLPVVTGEVGEVGADSFTIVQGDGTTVTVRVGGDPSRLVSAIAALEGVTRVEWAT